MQEHSGFGIASKLINECIKKMNKNHCEAYITTTRKHAGITNIANVLLKNDFIKGFEIPNYWYEDSLKEGYMCPQCGNPCHCSCVIYFKI